MSDRREWERAMLLAAAATALGLEQRSVAGRQP
jgi:hypothetical protein